MLSKQQSPTPDLEGPIFLPMLELFQQLRSAGMKLTIEQYDLLRQALDEDYGLSSWEDLRDLCRFLWVKPSLNYDAETFEQVFDEFEDRYQQKFAAWLRKQRAAALPVASASLKQVKLGVLPALPKREFPGEAEAESQSPGQKISGYGLDAVKHDRPNRRRSKPEYIVELPISQEQVRQTWSGLRRPLPDMRLRELDVDATVERIGREGSFANLVQRPVLQKKADLLLLVDESNSMLPFAPVVQPFIDMVLSRRISPAQIYRFKHCPTDFLYEWKRPLRGIALAKVLGRLNRLRTVVMILSDAGAASPVYSDERVVRTGQFLARLVPCVREVIWLNPLPELRWLDTTAEPIQSALAGRMLEFKAQQVQQLVRKREFQSEVQLWPLMQR